MNLIKSVNELLDNSDHKGSQVKKLLYTRAIKAEIEKWENNFGFSFPQEVTDYAENLGKGLDFSNLDDDNWYLAELVPSFNILNLDSSAFFVSRKELSNSIFTKYHSVYFDGHDYIPFMWNGVDFISFSKTKHGGIGVIVKRSGYKNPTELWPSASDFFLFHAQCWSSDIYKINSELKIVYRNDSAFEMLIVEREKKSMVTIKFE
jgi:hypothetical protein